MCTNQREIINKYTGHKLYVKCGHCPACLQEKASYRVQRIKANDSPDTEPLMVTLTYARHDCPYVKRDEAYKFSRGELKTLSVYRDTFYRKVRFNSSYDIKYKKVVGEHKLADIDLIDSCSFKNNRDLSHTFNKIGVCYYPDVQHFMSRLRINLNRKYGFTQPFKAYCTSEYGSRSLRPHFHLLLWIPKGTFETFRSAIVESWAFSDLSRFERSIEKAFRASSYVASYVNCNADFPDFLARYFKPKHSYSKDFGCNLDIYKIGSILSRISRGSLSYTSQKDINGVPTIVELPLPQYVIHRYFPKFKGYNRLTPAALSDYMYRLVELGNEKNYNIFFAKLNHLNRDSFPVYFAAEDIWKIRTRLVNAYEKFKKLANEPKTTFEEYCSLHQRAWRVYSSTCLRLHLINDSVPFNEKYDNLEEIRCTHIYNGTPLPIGFSMDDFRVTNPNEFRTTQFNTWKYYTSYFEHLKHRNVSNVIISSFNEEF